MSRFPTGSPLLRQRALRWVTSTRATCSIVGDVYVDDLQGGRTKTGTTVKASGVSCWYGPARVRMVNAEEVIIGGQVGTMLAWTILVPQNALPAVTSIAVTDQVLIGARTFEVNGIGSDAPWLATLDLLCREIT